MDDSRTREKLDQRLDEQLDESLQNPGEEAEQTVSSEALDRRLYRALALYIVLGALAYWRLDGELLWFILFLFAVLAIKTYLVVVQRKLD